MAEHGIVGGEGGAEREERHERDVVLEACVQHRLRGAVDEVVGVLDRDDLGAIQRDSQVVEADAGQADAADQPFVARGDHGGQLTVEQLAVDVADCAGIARVDPQVDGGQPVGAKGLQVLLDVGAQFVGFLCGVPVALLITARADLAHQSQACGVRVECLADEFVGHLRAVELCGVDVVDAEVDGPAQDGERFIVVARRAEDPRAG